MVVVIVVVVLLAVGAGAIVGLRARARAAERDGEGANEILQSPPTSFPSDLPLGTTPASQPRPAALPTAGPAASRPALPSVGPASPASPVTAATPSATTDQAPDKAPEADAGDDATAARFRAPGSRSTSSAGDATARPAAPRYPLEPAVLVPADEPVAPSSTPDWSPVAAEPASESEPSPVAEVEAPAADLTEAGQPAAETDEPGQPAAETDVPAQPATEAAETAETTEAAAVEQPTVAPKTPTLTLVNGDTVIDLGASSEGHEVDADEAAWHAVDLEPEPDAVDHVLQALITRARFKQVGVEEVATELVERADLRGEEVADVLAELVGRADQELPARSSELVLFNDEVPSRPGQLTDFAKLGPADKKRIIIRVLCLLVARSEDQQLPPRSSGEAAARSWPLARAVWPAAMSEDEPEVALPSRLAKSG